MDCVVPSFTDLKAYQSINAPALPQSDARINAVARQHRPENHRAFHLTLPTHAAKLLTSSLSSSLSTV